jgi:demethylmenaquinone methyltransferase/2-methoxy-6-polyprenyl-1,4-benzoquinol methylase
MAGQEDSHKISGVHRTKEEAKKTYDRISTIYYWLGGIFERRLARKALSYLKVESGETVLEIGFGTGYCLQQIALTVGNTGMAYGIDVSEGMLRVTRKRLQKATLLNRVELFHGDASKLPFINETFNAVFMSFTLELFDTPDIPQLLTEVRRVMKAGGRLGVVSLSRSKGNSVPLRIYEWIHRKWPKYVDCRPIYLEHLLHRAGYTIQRKKMDNLFVLPLEIVVAIK